MRLSALHTILAEVGYEGCGPADAVAKVDRKALA